MVHRLALASTCLTLLFAFSQTADAAEKIDAKYREAVKRFLIAQKTPQAVSDQLTFSIAQQALSSVAANGITVTEPMQEIVVDVARESFGARLGEIGYLTDLYAPIYAEFYTEKDLRDLIAFWETPVGVKTIEQLPKMTETSYNALEKASEAYVTEFQETVDKRLREAGIVVTP